MDKTEYVKLSWMAAEKAGVSRRDWCAAMAEKLQGRQPVKPKKKKPAFVKELPLIKWSCKHRGDVVGMTKCASCGGGKKPLEIFECSLLGNCTVDKMPEPDGPSVKGLCKLCPSREGQPIIE
jgi:hypothetical protein